ncbi:unnamed protein product [Cuscuta epithymum]|uniref:Hemerythrin-like domain-containing protein n=1 Tax=Cuscuta epithymum TaxID=186058 RepID=A0AAV0GLE1_9ASTE|nr:unnamed protein product [Cuscuta epithymum]
MGNCVICIKCPTNSTAEFTPAAVFSHRPVDVVKPDDQPKVKLYGAPFGNDTYYIRFALMYKPVSVDFVASDGHEVPAIEYNSDVVSGSVENLVRYLDATFPEPRLLLAGGRWHGEMPPSVACVVTLQHRSMIWHLERMVKWAEELAARGGKARGNPAACTPRMEIKKFGKRYSMLMEVMLEHAQMEEKNVFPILEKADRGLCKFANANHAMDLPVMNGIQEDIKSIVVLDPKKPIYREAISNLSKRLKTFKEDSRQHFGEEEKKLLPLLSEAAELGKMKQARFVGQCLDSMQGTHSRLFRFFMEGFLPADAMQYLNIIAKCSDKERVSRLFRLIVEKENSLGWAIGNPLA